MPATIKLTVIVSDNHIIVSGNLVAVSDNHIADAVNLIDNVRLNRNTVGVNWLKVVNSVCRDFNNDRVVGRVFCPAVHGVKVNSTDAICVARRVYCRANYIAHHHLASSRLIGGKEPINNTF